MRIMMDASSSDQHHNSNYDFAIANIDLEGAQLLARYFNLFDTVKNTEEMFIEMTFHSVGIECEFYDYDVLGGKEDIDDTIPVSVKESLDNKGYAIIPEDFKLPFSSDDSHRPFELVIQVGEEGFWWNALPEDVDFNVTTENLPRNLIVSILGNSDVLE